MRLALLFCLPAVGYAQSCPTNCAGGCQLPDTRCIGFDSPSNFDPNNAGHCVPGFWGSRCDLDCPSGCAQAGCTGQGFCNGYQLTANADPNPAAHCDVGYYGSRCDLICPSQCSQPGCTGGGYCNGYDLAANEDPNPAGHCNVGRFSSRCDSICPSRCAQPGCTGDGYCNGYDLAANRDPNPSGHCDPGFYSSRCDSSCPTQCAAGTCTTYGYCSGYADAANQPPNIAGQCNSGRYGTRCTSICPSQCSPCTNNGGCCSDSPTKRPDEVIPGSEDGLGATVDGFPSGEVLTTPSGIPYGVALSIPVKVTKVFTVEVVCRYCTGEEQRQVHRIPVSKTVDVKLPYTGFRGLTKLVAQFIPGLNMLSTALTVYDFIVAVQQAVDTLVNLDEIVQHMLSYTYCTKGGIQGRRLLQANGTNATILVPVNDSIVNFARTNITINVPVPNYDTSVCESTGTALKRCVCDNETAANTCAEIGTVNASFWRASPGSGWDTAICQPQVCGGQPVNSMAGVTVTYTLDPTVTFDGFTNAQALAFLAALLGQSVDSGTFVVSVTTNHLAPGTVVVQVYSPIAADNATLIAFSGSVPLVVVKATSTSGFNNAPPVVPPYTRAPTSHAPSTSIAPSRTPTGSRAPSRGGDQTVNRAASLSSALALGIPVVFIFAQ